MVGMLWRVIVPMVITMILQKREQVKSVNVMINKETIVRPDGQGLAEKGG